MRYEVHRARRQYDQADPENRLVTQELERRWESALQALSQTEHAYEQDRARMQSEAQKRIPPALKAQLASLGQALPGLWPQLPTATRKELLRCLIDKVVLTRLPCLVQLQVRIVWRGGADTEKELRVPAPLHLAPKEYPALVERALALVASDLNDDQVAEQLTAEGFRSLKSSRVYAGTVTRIRRQAGKPEGGVPSDPTALLSTLSVRAVARRLGVPASWIYFHIYQGHIQVDRHKETGNYLLPDTKNTFSRLQQLRDHTAQNINLTLEQQDA